MLLIAENEVNDLDAYLRYFVPLAAKSIHAAGAQYLACGEAVSLSNHSRTRVVVVRFEDIHQLQRWWHSSERQQAWEIGAKYAQLRNVAIDVDVPAVRLPLTVHRDAGRLREHVFSRAETSLFFLQQETRAPEATGLGRLGLSTRESEVLTWVAQGKTNGEIATILSMNLGTVKKHLAHIFQKLGVETRIAAAVLALEVGFHSEKTATDSQLAKSQA